MNRPRKTKSVLLFAGLTLGISALIAVTALAYTSGTAGHGAANVSSAEIDQAPHTAADVLTGTADPETAASSIDRGSAVTLHKKTTGASSSTEQKKTGTTGSAASGTAASKSAQDSQTSTQDSNSPAQSSHSSTKETAQSGGVSASEKSDTNANQSSTSDGKKTLAAAQSSDDKKTSTAAQSSDGSASPKEETPAAPAAPAPAETQPSPAAKTTAASDSYSDKELDLLARLICAEAQGESYDAKVAVGAVVINRVQSGLFADSITDVIYQNIDGYWQFTPVANGWIDKPADSDSVSAAKDALNGADPTNGALWYYDDSTTNQFLLAKKVAVKLDHMIFAY